MSIDLRLMRYVIAIAETGSFEAAAERLHITQPPLSRQIRGLEQHLGVRLFHRRPTRLTEPGRVFVESARRVIAEADQAVERTRRAGAALGGVVRLGYTVTASFDEMPKLFTAMAAEHPNVRVQAHEAWDNQLDQALRAGELDALLGRHLTVPSTFRTTTLRRDRYAVFVGAKHRLAQRQRVALCDLRGETLRFFPRRFAPDYYDAVLEAVHSTGESFDIWENPLPGLRNLSINLHDRGFMVLPQSLGDHLPADITCLPITDELPGVDLTLSVPRRHTTPATQLLMETARQLARREGWVRPPQRG